MAGPTLSQLLKLMQRMLDAEQPAALRQELAQSYERLAALQAQAAPAGAAWASQDCLA